MSVRWRGGRSAGREQRGAILVLVATSMTVIMASTALAVDVGRIVATNRTLQADADLIALDASQALKGCPSCPLATVQPIVLAAANGSAQRNAVGGYSDRWVVLGGYAYDTTGVGHFTPYTDPLAIPNAVQVRPSATVPFFFQAGSATASRSAVAGLNAPVALPPPTVPTTPPPPPTSSPTTTTLPGPTTTVPPGTTTTTLPRTMTGQAFALSSIGPLPIGPVPDTGPVSTAAAGTTTTPCLASLAALGIGASLLCPNVTTVVTPTQQSTAMASVAGVGINVVGLPAISLGAVQATSITNCAGSTGTATIARLTIAGTVINLVGVVVNGGIQPPPNTTVVAGQGLVSVVLNEQIPGPGVLTVNAVHIKVLTILGALGLDLIVSSATSDIHNC